MNKSQINSKILRKKVNLKRNSSTFKQAIFHILIVIVIVFYFNAESQKKSKTAGIGTFKFIAPEL